MSACEVLLGGGFYIPRVSRPPGLPSVCSSVRLFLISAQVRPSVDGPVEPRVRSVSRARRSAKTAIIDRAARRPACPLEREG